MPLIKSGSSAVLWFDCTLCTQSHLRSLTNLPDTTDEGIKVRDSPWQPTLLHLL